MNSQANKPLLPDQTLGSQQLKPENLAGTPGDLSMGQSQRDVLGQINLPPASAQSKQFADLRPEAG